MGWVVLVVAILLFMAAFDILVGPWLYAYLRGDGIDPEAHAELARKREDK